MRGVSGTQVAFARCGATRLFQAADTAADWWGFLLPAASSAPADPIPLARALEDAELAGSFVYAARAPDLAESDAAAAFVAAIDAIVAAGGGQRAIIWLEDGRAAVIPPTLATVQRLTRIGGQVRTNTAFDVPLTAAIAVAITPGAVLTVPAGGDAILVTGNGSPPLSLTGSPAPVVQQADDTALLHFGGPACGGFTFALAIQRRSLARNLAWGFQLLIPNPAVGRRSELPFLAAWLPLADGELPVPTDLVGFAAQVNVVNPNNSIEAARTVLFFTGIDRSGPRQEETRLVSSFRTAFGQVISLYPATAGTPGTLPAGLVADRGYKKTPRGNGYAFGPVGDFFLGLPERLDAGRPALLLCGASGSETIAFKPRDAATRTGGRLRFTGGRSAFAPSFPLQQASPTGPPIDPSASLMSADFRTSWGTVLGTPGTAEVALYAAAPKGADLFGKPAASDLADDLADDPANGLLQPRAPGAGLSDETLSFPLFALQGFVPGTGEQDLTAAQLALLESQIVGPTRRAAITRATRDLFPTAAASLGIPRPAGADAPFNTATPGGYIARVDGGRWSRLLLAQTMAGAAVSRQIGFASPTAELQAAFQTDNLLLVVANADKLGAFAAGVMPDAPAPGAKPAFFNEIGFGGWVFEAAVGGGAYGDYRNVMIVKGTRGALTDLANSPEKWTQKDTFAAPKGPAGQPDPSQLIPLSNWLSRYFAAALARKDDPYFADFCRLITQESWQGILLLRVDVKALPAELLGLLAGVSRADAFSAHHIGIEISQVDGATVEQKDGSSLFGLVHYVDPDYDDAAVPHAITPSNPDADFELKVLALKALFRNSTLQTFECATQVVLNTLFGSRVAAMRGEGANPFNAVLLRGSTQDNGGAPVYALAAVAPASYRLANDILTTVEIDVAAMSTRDTGATTKRVTSWIAMAGRMSFAAIPAPQPSDGAPPFDIFSFGPEDGTGAGEGLAYAALGLSIAYPVGKPAEATLAMEERELFLDVANSQARPLSLYRNLQLQLQGLRSGGGDTSPESLGFLRFATPPYALPGVSGAWHGLAFGLDMGTPGALAGKVGLTATLLVAWADDSGANGSGGSGFAAFAGLQLPGSGSGGELFSLQTVLKLSVGTLQLLYSAPSKGFLLVMNDIALKFLGLLKLPPNGSTSFLLFGNPEAGSATGLGWYAIYNQDLPKPPAPSEQSALAPVPPRLLAIDDVTVKGP